MTYKEKLTMCYITIKVCCYILILNGIYSIYRTFVHWSNSEPIIFSIFNVLFDFVMGFYFLKTTKSIKKDIEKEN